MIIQAKIGASNSNPHSSIKVSSIDQHVLPFSPAQISTSSPNAAQQQQPEEPATTTTDTTDSHSI